MLSRVTIVTVSYNSGAVLGQLLGTLQHPDIDIIVVDNDSADNSQAIARSFANVRFIQSSNIGYGRAANLGFAQVTTPYALLLNPDVIITPDAIEKMIGRMEVHASIGILGAQMFYYNAAGEKKYTRSESFDKEGIAYTHWLVGAAMLIRMEVLRSLGGFDENIFLFYEETDLCKRFVKAGYKLAITRDAEALHIEGTSCAPCSRVTKIKNWHAGWSRAYYSRKHSVGWDYLSDCIVRLCNMCMRLLRAIILGDKVSMLRHYHTMRGVLAEIMGKKSFKNGVGRHT